MRPAGAATKRIANPDWIPAITSRGSLDKPKGPSSCGADADRQPTRHPCDFVFGQIGDAQGRHAEREQDESATAIAKTRPRIRITTTSAAPRL